MPQRLILGWLAVAAVLLGLAWLLSPVLTPFLTAAVLAYALHPLVDRLSGQRRGGLLPRLRLPRVLAAAVVELLAIAAVLGVLLLMVPILSRELPLLREQIPVLAQRLNDSLAPRLAEFGITLALDVASIKAFALKYLNANFEDWLATVLSSARIGGSFLLAIVGNAVLLPVVLYYLLLEWPRWIAQLRALVPLRAASAVDGFFVECDAILGQYLHGQLLLMGSLALYYAGALALAGFDLAVPVGVFTGLAVFVPYIGFGLGAVLALMAGVLQFDGAYGVVAVAVIYGVGQLLESFVLTPRLVGERIGLHPLAVIFVLLAFGHLFGFVGVLIALPLGALAVVAWRRLLTAYSASALYRG